MRHRNEHQARIAKAEADRQLLALARGAAQHISGAAARMRQEVREVKLVKQSKQFDRSYRLGLGGVSVGRQKGRSR